MIVVSDMMGTLTTGSPFLGLGGLGETTIRSKLRGAKSVHAAIARPTSLQGTDGSTGSYWGQKLMVDSLAYIRQAG